jgi:transcriptional regulator with XRE-family HTH domain
MEPKDRFKRLEEQFKNDPEYIAERLILDLTEQIAKRLQEGSLTRSELAKRLKVSNAYITKLMRGEQNLTIRTIVQIANALGCTLDLSIIPQEPGVIGAITIKRPTNADFNRTVKPCDDCEGLFAAAA